MSIGKKLITDFAKRRIGKLDDSPSSLLFAEFIQTTLDNADPMN